MLGKLLVLGAIVGAGVFVARKVGLIGGGEEPVEYAPESGWGEPSGGAGSANDGEQHTSQE